MQSEGFFVITYSNVAGVRKLAGPFHFEIAGATTCCGQFIWICELRL